MTRIGAQGFTLRQEFAELGPYETLRRVADIGFKTIEISQVPMTDENVAEMQRAGDDFGIEYAALSAPLDANPSRPEASLSEGMDKIVADCRALESRYVRIGMLPHQSLRSRQTLVEFARRADRAAVQLADEGITLCYHNHHVEFARFDGDYLLDIIRESAPSMKFEIDVHWVHRGGVDPVKTLRDYAGIADLVHLKDYRIGLPSPASFDALERGDMDTWRAAYADVVQFAEVGEGSLDFPAIIEQAKESGARHLLIEQDRTYDRTAFEALQVSHDNLVKLGYADLM